VVVVAQAEAMRGLNRVTVGAIIFGLVLMVGAQVIAQEQILALENSIKNAEDPIDAAQYAESVACVNSNGVVGSSSYTACQQAIITTQEITTASFAKVQLSFTPASTGYGMLAVGLFIIGLALVWSPDVESSPAPEKGPPTGPQARLGDVKSDSAQ
jgi:hypothetical protein